MILLILLPAIFLNRKNKKDIQEIKTKRSLSRKASLIFYILFFNDELGGPEKTRTSDPTLIKRVL